MYKETYHNDELQHFGIKGMKWGVRNASGNTSESRVERRVQKLQSSASKAGDKALKRARPSQSGLKTEAKNWLLKENIKNNQETAVLKQVKANKLIKKHGLTSIKPTYNSYDMKKRYEDAELKPMSSVPREGFGQTERTRRNIKIAARVVLATITISNLNALVVSR